MTGLPITSNESNVALIYHKKSHFFRFSIVYFFVLRWSAAILWHYHVKSRFIAAKELQIQEDILYYKLAKECKTLFLKLGGVYIKAGQFFSNLAHILPATFLDTLKDLQDRVPPRSFVEIRERFFKEFDKNIEDVFPDIDKDPLASASTAQVHRATIDGRKVAIKILYPGIESLVDKDLKTIHFVLKWINRYLFTFDYVTIHREIEEVIHREMDMKEEAISIKRMAEFFKDEKDYIFPHVYDEFNTRGILVTRFIEGVKITETRINTRRNAKLSRPLDLLIRAYVLMIFHYRFFHADPHSGNIIYTPQGKLCFIDFGAVSEVPQNIAISLKKIVLSAINNDYYSLIEAMEEMGFFEPGVNREKLEQIAQYAIEKLRRFVTDTEFFQNISLDQLKPEDAYIFLKGINSSLRELMRVVKVPNNYVMLERVFGILVGTAAVLDPYRTIFDYSENHFQALVENNKKELSQIVKDEGAEVALAAFQLPRELQKTLITLNRGRIKIINKDIEKHTEKMYALGHEVIFAIFGIAGIYFANQFYLMNQFYISSFFYGFSVLTGIALIRSFQKNRTKKL